MTCLKMNSRKIVAASLALGLLTGANAASAGESQSGTTYRLRATVPVACWVRPQGSVLAGSGRTGAVVEACNSPGGFTVSASYRQLKDTEKAVMTYGDRMIDLSKTGEQMLRRSNMATIRTVDYSFGQVDLDEPLILSLTIQPI
ncbi:hypothetical protein [Brevundimonas sp.]